MASDAASAASLLARAEEAWAGGDGEAAMAFFGRAADLAEADGDLDTRVAAVLGLARGQEYNLTPGLLPVRLHAAYDADDRARRPRARLAAALARCWAYAERAAAGPAVRARGAGPRRRTGRPAAARRRARRGAGLALGPRRPGPAPRLGGPARRRGRLPARPGRAAAGPALGAHGRVGGARPPADAPLHAGARAARRGVSPGPVLRGQPPAALELLRRQRRRRARCSSSRPRRRPQRR